ncbi:MAG: abortive infection family protein [bacterium]|nr:abortive infection family protein [bacterium]
MKNVIELIKHNNKSHPEFQYYIPLIEKALSNLSKHPDITIEICKSLLEGVSKSILERTTDQFSRADLDKMDVAPLVKQATFQLRYHDNVYEDEFTRICFTLAQAMGTLRNARADISHGKAVPKLKQSNEKLSTFSMQMTACIIHYMLDALFSIPPAISDSDEEEEEKVVKYEDNPEFNLYLDEERPIEGRVLYSRALFEQYNEDYLIQLSDFEYIQENEGDN